MRRLIRVISGSLHFGNPSQKCRLLFHLPRAVSTHHIQPTIMPHLITTALLAPILAACALPHQRNAMNIADYLPVAVVSHDIFLDGGSVELTVRDMAGNERRYFRNRSLDSQGTPRYNQITTENGRTLTEEEQTALLAQLSKLRAQCAPSCQTALNDFIGRAAE